LAGPKEIAQEIDEDVSLVSYHVKALAKLDFVEVVREVKRRGATEHFYRGKLLSASLSSEVFERRADRHHSLQEYMVDEQGWADAMKALEVCMCRIIEIRQESAERRHISNDPGISVSDFPHRIRAGPAMAVE